MVLILCFTPFWLMKGVIGMLSFRQRGKSLDVIHNGLFSDVTDPHISIDHASPISLSQFLLN